MKKIFPEYYSKNKKDFKELWESSTFIFDTNIFLNLYRYSNSTRKDWISLFEKLKGRIYIPHQVALEYQKNRLGVILGESRNNELFLKKSQELLEVVKEEFKKNRRFSDSLTTATKSFTALSDSIKKTAEEHPDFLTKDTVRDFLDSRLTKKVGEAFTDVELEQIYAEGKARYSQKIPPGYEDDSKERKKGVNSQYGDLILWKSILKYSKENGVNIIFISDDQKDDWWYNVKGRNQGPRPELLKEFSIETSQLYHQYQPDQFLKHASYLFKSTIELDSITETKVFSEKEEQKENSKNRYKTSKGLRLKDIYLSDGYPIEIFSYPPTKGDAKMRTYKKLEETLKRMELYNRRHPCPFCKAEEVYTLDTVPLNCPNCDETIGS